MRKLFFPLFFIVMLLVPLEVVHGETSTGDVNYSVEAILPEKNQNPDVSYFDLLVEPEEEVELQLMVQNYGNTALDVNVAITDATTNSNGLIIYEEDEELDPSLETPLSELIELEEETITVPAGASKPFIAHLKLPEEKFDGVKLGGFRVQEVPEESSEEGSEGIEIKNEYAYVIGLQIRENDVEVMSQLELKSIEPDLFNYRTTVKVNLQNPTPTVIQDLDISAEVFQGNGDEPIHTATQEDGSFAPHSNMNFYIDWGNQPLEAGDYRLELRASDGKNEWLWDENFTIEREADLAELNESAVELDNSSNITQLLIIVIVILILVIGALLIRQYKLRQNNN